MKLCRYGNPGAERPGLVDGDGAIRDLSGVIGDIDAKVLGREGLRRLAALDPSTLPRVDGSPRFGVPVAHVGKMLCVGMNYADHAAETNAPVPEQPVLFMKATTAIGGANDEDLAVGTEPQISNGGTVRCQHARRGGLGDRPEAHPTGLIAGGEHLTVGREGQAGNSPCLTSQGGQGLGI